MFKAKQYKTKQSLEINQSINHLNSLPTKQSNTIQRIEYKWKQNNPSQFFTSVVCILNYAKENKRKQNKNETIFKITYLLPQ